MTCPTCSHAAHRRGHCAHSLGRDEFFGGLMMCPCQAGARLAIVVSARPSYARVRTLIQALQAQADVTVVVVGSALLERYGSVVDVIRRDCGPVETCWTVVEGETLETTARSTALTLLDVAAVLRRVRPDAVIVHADRHEVLGAAMAARYLELPLIHLQGGEQTGSIDDRVRDAITQLADCHLVSTETAAARVWAMRGHRAVVTGCPSIDVAVAATDGPPVTLEELGGDGADVDLSQPFLVVLQHPVSDHAEDAFIEMGITLMGCELSGLPMVVFWPGNEAGMAGASKAIRMWKPLLPMRTVRNLPPERFLKLLTQAACLVGNSSAGLRECSALGVPVVNIGDRQVRRERAANVVDCATVVHEITEAIRTQSGGRYAPSTLYGDGHGGEKMAAAIMEFVHGTDRRVGVGAWGKHRLGQTDDRLRGGGRGDDGQDAGVSARVGQSGGPASLVVAPVRAK